MVRCSPSAEWSATFWPSPDKHKHSSTDDLAQSQSCRSGVLSKPGDQSPRELDGECNLGVPYGNRSVQLLRQIEVAIRLSEGYGACSCKLGGCLGKLLVTQQLSGKIESLCFLDIAGSGHVTYKYNLLRHKSSVFFSSCKAYFPGKLEVTFCVRGVISPLLSNLYLNEVDKMLERAIEVTRYEQYTAVQYARFADDLVILVDFHPRHDWIVPAVVRRLREELGKLRVEINEEKSRIVDLRKGGSFGFLGFEFRRVLSVKGVWRPQYTPKLKKRTALLAKLRDIFRRFQSQPVGRVIELINPILRGWVNYFAAGHSSECFSFIQDWIEKKIRRHLMRARNRKGFGWKRWSRGWLYEVLGLFNGYRVQRFETSPKVVPAR